MKSGDFNLSLEQAIQLADEAYRIREFGPLTVQGKALVVLLSRIRELEAPQHTEARAPEQGGEMREAPDFDHYWKIVIGWAQDMGTIKRLSVHQIRMLCERLQSITAHALLTSDSAEPAEEQIALTDGRCPACGRDRLGEPSGWTLCDYGNEATLPAMGELVELAVVNNGKMARTFGGRAACDEAWAWASAEPQLLWAGLPVGLEEPFEWDEDESRTVYWRKLAPLPPPPTDLPNGQNGA